ncbi:MAG: folate family ECF transporter S component [Lachnospiraceae bacterium]|nr:folate family ECF transporter S component [Lachnospiraceae bacterium]
MERKIFDTKEFVILAACVAVEIVLSRFLSITAWDTKYSLGFIAVMVAAMLYGPIAGGLVGAMSDLLGALLFPIGPYFAGFTLTAFLTGLLFGLLLHKKPNVVKLVIAVVINQFILTLLLNTFWITVLYTTPFVPLLSTRVTQSVVMTVVQTAFGLVLMHVIPRIRKEAGRQ